MPKHSACNLASINLSEFIKSPFTAKAHFNSEDFIKTVKIAVRGLDTVLDENLDNHALPEQRAMAENYRNIGLGIMGLHDALIKLGITYGSPESVQFADQVMGLMFRTAVIASAELAKELGPFPKYSENLFRSDIIQAHFSQAEIEALGLMNCGLRNCSLLSIAPTGSLGTMLNISTGCEPLFALSYTRKTESLNGGEDKYYKVYTGVVDEYRNAGGDADLLPSYFNTSADLKWHDRIDMQSALQKHTDTAISSTINLPEEITVDEIEKLYLYAWEKGLKGVTIFRANCKRLGILTTGSEPKEEDTAQDNEQVDAPVLKRGDIIDCSDDLIGKKHKLTSGCGSLHCLAYFDPDNGDLQEVYLTKGSTGGCVDADTEYFNGSEWKRISEYNPDTDEKVLQYSEDGVAKLVKPINYIVNNNVATLKRFSNNYGLDMVLSNDHRMYLYKNYRKYSMGIRENLTSEIVTVGDYLSRDGSKERHVPTTFCFKAPGICLSNEMIRLLVAIYADGTYDGHKIIVQLKREDKKNRMRKLLKDCDIGYSEKSIHNTDRTNFYLYPVPSIANWFIDKQFTAKWYDCTDDQLRVVVDECVYWDGSLGEGNRLGSYYTSKKNEADFMQFALTRLGYRATIALNNSTKSDKNSYRIRWTKQNVHNLEYAKVEDYETTDGKSYCFTVPSGLLVLRRNNQIFITGNCNNFMIGLSRMISLAARAGVDIYTIVDQLDSTGACPSYRARTVTKHDTSKGSCCPMAVGKALLEMWKEVQDELGLDDEPKGVATPKKIAKAVKDTAKYVEHAVIDAKKPDAMPLKEAIEMTKEYKKPVAVVTGRGVFINQDVEKSVALCPDCGEPLRFEGGCNSCPNCGYSKCN